ncbi:MAG: amino acid permease [Bacteroidetes bacterium]|nr:amino acid permease [Bacteroidota bacterium]MBS1541177.1 amino acid permease [Bacteroidota bacterium]
MTPKSQYSLSVGITVVIANMIGTGVFTSLGYQVGPLPSGFSILFLWGLGGVVALCGAFTYAEIAARFKKSGGEYYYLGQLYHPSVGFAAGWISLLVGFAGAISAVAIAIGEYAHKLIGVPVSVIAIAAIVLVTSIHWFGVKAGGLAQNILTSLKLLLILVFCVAPFIISNAPVSGNTFLPQMSDVDMIFSGGFAVSLVYVVYAYSGWNAAAYIAGNLENQEKNLPRSLILGTLVVVTSYILLNATFLRVADFHELEGKNDIGNVVAFKLFGPAIGAVFAALFSTALLSTLSAMTIAGPRVLEAMGDDYPKLKQFSATNRFEMPYIALLVQGAWSIFLVLVSDFKVIIQYISVSLSFFTLLTVAGVFIVRKKYPASSYRMPLYPLVPIFFMAVTLWMIYFEFDKNPWVILYSVATVLSGFLIYLWVSKK